MSLDLEYEKFLTTHTDGALVFEFQGRHYRLKTRPELFERVAFGRLSIPFISCLMACRQRLLEGGHSEDDVTAIDGTAIGEYSDDIVFISHEAGSVCVHFSDGTADVEELAPSIGEFLEGLKPI